MATRKNDNEMVLRIPCRPEYARIVRLAVADFAQSLKMPASAVEEIEIAASEAVANVIRHAYRGTSRNACVRIKCAQDNKGIVVEIVDNGRGFDPPAGNTIPPVNLDREGGFGIILMKCLMDHVNYISKPDAGTRVKMTKAFPTVRTRPRARRAIR